MVGKYWPQDQPWARPQQVLWFPVDPRLVWQLVDQKAKLLAGPMQVQAGLQRQMVEEKVVVVLEPLLEEHRPEEETWVVFDPMEMELPQEFE